MTNLAILDHDDDEAQSTPVIRGGISFAHEYRSIDVVGLAVR